MQIRHDDDLYKHLRIAPKAYHKRYGHHDRQGRIKSRVGIEKRPEIVETRDRIGDWESGRYDHRQRAS